jgi:hypothetical protein
MLIDHASYIADLCGPVHVGLGFDFADDRCGPSVAIALRRTLIAGRTALGPEDSATAPQELADDRLFRPAYLRRPITPLALDHLTAVKITEWSLTDRQELPQRALLEHSHPATTLLACV